MKSQPNPPRLIDNLEFGNLVKSAASSRWSPERIVQNGQTLEAQVAGLTAVGAAAGTTAVAIKASTVAKIGLPLALGATVATTAVVWDGDEDPSQKVVEQIATTEVEPEKRIEVAPGSKEDRPEPALRKPRPAPRRPEPPKSTLAEQLGLFDAAKKAAAAGSYKEAITTLDRLRERFPETPLLAEVYLSSAEYLVESGRDEDALTFIDSILTDARVANKKAQLLRVVADTWLRKGVCDRAVPAYQRALGLGLPQEEASVARAGLKKCSR